MDEQIITSFKEDFLAIKNKGYVKSHRKHNTGIGKTFEDLIGVEENNNHLADYKGKIEIKSSRGGSNSMITLFTKAPSYPVGANNYLRRTFGTLNQDGNYNLHTTISATSYNTHMGKNGFKLELDNVNERLYIKIKELSTDRLYDRTCYYDYNILRDRIRGKCMCIAFITANSFMKDGQELFHFNKATLLSGMTFDLFLKGIESGDICYDIRIGTSKSGKKKGKPHDHGSGFRIKKNHIEKYFDNKEEI